MKYRILKINILACLLFFVVGNILFLAKAQKQDTIPANAGVDSVEVQASIGAPVVTRQDPRTLGRVMGGDSVIINVNREFAPNPNKAILYSAIFPGLGQVYNRKYWKLPLIYGGFLGVVYGVSWNGRYYSDYSKAYKELVLGTGYSWLNFTSYNQYDIERDPAKRSQLEANLKRRKDSMRQNRDLAIIVGVGLYALCIIDAYVDAQLYNFDISPDLSMHVTPVVYGPSAFSKFSVGLQCNVTF